MLTGWKFYLGTILGVTSKNFVLELMAVMHSKWIIWRVNATCDQILCRHISFDLDPLVKHLWTREIHCEQWTLILQLLKYSPHCQARRSAFFFEGCARFHPQCKVVFFVSIWCFDCLICRWVSVRSVLAWVVIYMRTNTWKRSLEMADKFSGVDVCCADPEGQLYLQYSA